MVDSPPWSKVALVTVCCVTVVDSAQWSNVRLVTVCWVTGVDSPPWSKVRWMRVHSGPPLSKVGAGDSVLCYSG